MAYMIQITEEKKEKLSELCNKVLRYGGKMMQCLESLDEEDEEIGMRQWEDDDYDEDMGMRDGGTRGRMNMRRGRVGTGRYSRY